MSVVKKPNIIVDMQRVNNSLTRLEYLNFLLDNDYITVNGESSDNDIKIDPFTNSNKYRDILDVHNDVVPYTIDLEIADSILNLCTSKDPDSIILGLTMLLKTKVSIVYPIIGYLYDYGTACNSDRINRRKLSNVIHNIKILSNMIYGTGVVSTSKEEIYNFIKLVKHTKSQFDKDMMFTSRIKKMFLRDFINLIDLESIVPYEPNSSINK